MCVCSFAGVVCLCGGLFICAPLCLFGWLVVCVCVCLLVFWHLGAHFGFVVALCGALWRLCGTWVTLGLHCGTLGLQLGTRGAHFGVFLALWGTFGGHLGALGLHLGTLGLHVGALLALLGVALDPFGHFWGKGSKKVPKVTENASQNGNIFDDISTFRGKWRFPSEVIWTRQASQIRTLEVSGCSCFHPLALPLEPLVSASFFLRF